MRRLSLHVALLLASLVVALGAAELATRWWFRDLTTTSPIGTWFGLRWKAEHLRRNELGYRDRPVPAQAPPGERRILVIGDSFTVAMGIDEEQRYTERIERELDARGGGFRVLVFAAPGQELDGHLATLRERGLATDPDFVLLQWYVNDVEVVPGVEPVSGPPVPLARLHRELAARSAFYSLLSLQWRALRFRLGLLPDYGEVMAERYSDPAGDIRFSMDLLRQFFAESGRAGVPVGMVLFPHLSSRRGEDYPFAFLHDRVLAECRLYRVPCVDLRQTFAPHPTDRLRLNRFDHHASAFAHELAADALLEAFGAEWMTLPRARSAPASAGLDTRVPARPVE